MTSSALNETHKNFYFEALRDLVRIPSRSTRHGGEEARVQEYVAAQMRSAGARVKSFEASDYPEFFTHPLCSDPDREYSRRPTVLAEFGPPDAEAILVLAHSDTVPIFEPQNWTRDPFDPGDEPDVIYGLGVGDDKWGTATLLLLAKVLGESASSLSRKIILASTIDEENGVGNGVLLLHLAGIKAAAALYLDGWDSLILLGNLGGGMFTLEATNTISPEQWERDAAALEAACREISRERSRSFEKSFLRDNAMRDCSVALRRAFDENTPRLLVPFYTLDGEDGEELAARIEAVIERALAENFHRYAVSCDKPWFEPAFTPPSTPLAQYMAEAFEEVNGMKPQITRGSKQDAFVLINHARIPTVSFGPARHGVPGAYHSPDEFIDAHTTWRAVLVAHRAVQKWLGGEAAP